MFKYLIFFIIFIVVVVIVLSQRSNISESFSDWISPATSEHNQQQVAILPKFANMDVYFDLNNGSVYLINVDKVMVLRRRRQPKYPIFNISSDNGLNKLKKYCSERNKMNKHYEHWIYKHDDKNMLIYAPTGLKTKITLMTKMDGDEDIKLIFLFNEESSPQNMSQFSDMEIKERNDKIIIQNKKNKGSGKHGGSVRTNKTPKQGKKKLEKGKKKLEKGKKKPEQGQNKLEKENPKSRPFTTTANTNISPRTTTITSATPAKKT